MIPHYAEKEEILNQLNSNEKTGLTDSEVQKRLAEYGENKLKGEKKKTVITVSDDKLCENPYDYACSVVWYGRNKSAALYTSDCYNPKIKYID